jgi:hypothetical protein
MFEIGSEEAQAQLRHEAYTQDMMIQDELLQDVALIANKHAQTGDDLANAVLAALEDYNLSADFMDQFLQAIADYIKGGDESE